MKAPVKLNPTREFICMKNHSVMPYFHREKYPWSAKTSKNCSQLPFSAESSVRSKAVQHVRAELIADSNRAPKTGLDSISNEKCQRSVRFLESSQKRDFRKFSVKFIMSVSFPIANTNDVKICPAEEVIDTKTNHWSSFGFCVQKYLE